MLRNILQQPGKHFTYLPTPGCRFPYYIGVVGKLTSLRIMTPKTPVAGASAGSLIAACHHAGLTEKQVTRCSSSQPCNDVTAVHFAPGVKPSSSRVLGSRLNSLQRQSDPHTLWLLCYLESTCTLLPASCP